MPCYLVTITPDGEITKEAITQLPKLDQLQKIVGGFIELIPYFDQYEGSACRAFCNEEGKLPHVGLPDNPTATAAWLAAVGVKRIPDHLVGNIAIIVGPPSFLRNM